MADPSDRAPGDLTAPQDDLALVRVLRQARLDFIKTIGGKFADAIPHFETIADDRLRAMVRNGAVALQVRHSWENVRAAAAAAGADIPQELMQHLQFPPNPPARVLQSGPELAELMNALRALGAWENDRLAAGLQAKLSPTTPAEYLFNWQQILDCLELKNNSEMKRHVAAMNRQYDGPIIPPERGGQPKVEKGKLLAWWNNLESQWETQGAGQNSKATVESQYDHGKSGTVVPEIGGHVKKKRADKK